ncbi:hypothetical protein ACJIZ3_010969 [Penstemon smallii]|uniref:Uncharacterized protein n=1 Tax=Penstemon smallii TaxID=265156 RepID=A0ABD3UJ85_9LAMI
MKPDGTFLPQSFRSRLSESGTLRLRPNRLALIAVHRHTAASRSAKFPISEQHGAFGGVTTTRPNKPFNKLAHTPNFKVSIGHVAGGGGKKKWFYPTLKLEGKILRFSLIHSLSSIDNNDEHMLNRAVDRGLGLLMGRILIRIHPNLV